MAMCQYLCHAGSGQEGYAPGVCARKTQNANTRDISTDLAETEVEKLKELSEGIEYEGDDEEFTSKLQTLCESYFPKGKVSSPVTNEPVVYEDEDLSVSMSAYSNAISRTNQSSKV